jgi:hypothetical protein
VYTDVARLQDFDELQSTESLKDVRLNWEEGLFIGDILPIVKKWRNLRRLTLISRSERSVLQFKVLCDFILGMKHLTYLKITLNCVQPESLRDKIHEIVLPRRPNFEFNVSHNLRHFR